VYLLSVDPGVQTGVALLSMEGGIIWTQTSYAEDKFFNLINALEKYPEAQVVMEDAPNTRHHQEVFQEVKRIIEETGRKPALVRPSQWKGHPASFVKLSEREGFETKHEGEAVGLGRWYLSQGRNDGQDQGCPDPAGAHS
jgi:hypothetical protein